jgi:two-component system, chemotaxis family, response regulator PixG
MTTVTSNPLAKLAKQLEAIANKKATGILMINPQTEGINIYFLEGRLLYLTSKPYPVRIWQRNIQQISPQWNPKISQISPQQPWEYQLLGQGVAKKEITPNQAKQIIAHIAQEYFFELGNQPTITFQWKNFAIPQSKILLHIALTFPEIKAIFSKSLQLSQQWKAATLTKLNPNFSPISTQKIAPNAYSGLGQYLNGEYSLWDVALATKKSIVMLTRALIPLVQKKAIQFKKIADLPNPLAEIKPKTPPETPPKPVEKLGLIACIDDSPLIGETIQKILNPIGYEILSIQDPMRGYAQLLKAKPKLIFLDLIMPNANGYSVCQSLRKTAVFKDIPIIILSSRDGELDRKKAQQVGANDFLGKPPQPETVLEMVHKYLT